jgi:hypothetical protein
MASAVSVDREAAVFAAPQLLSTQQPAPEREWHRMAVGPTPYVSEDAMRFGPRSYTPAQRIVVERAVAERVELSAPLLPRD